MVRDLEQIKENDESQLITKKEKGNSSNNGGHHCKWQQLRASNTWTINLKEKNVALLLHQNCYVLDMRDVSSPWLKLMKWFLS